MSVVEETDRLTMKRESDVRYVVLENLTEDQIADAQRAVEDLAKLLGRVSAQVCHEMGIQFDMDDPEVAREVMKITFEAMFLSAPNKPQRPAKAGEIKDR